MLSLLLLRWLLLFVFVEFSMVPCETFGWCQVEVFTEEGRVAQCRRHTCRRLRTAVDAHSHQIKARAAHRLEHAQGHRNAWVKVGATDAYQRVDGHHEHSSYGDTARDCTAAQYIAAHGKDEQESAQKLCGALGGHAEFCHHWGV